MRGDAGDFRYSGGFTRADDCRGPIARVALDHVLVEAADGTVTSYRVDQVLTQCFDFRADKTTCETLADIGYADKGRVTVVDGLAKRIDLLVLQQ